MFGYAVTKIEFECIDSVKLIVKSELKVKVIEQKICIKINSMIKRYKL